MQKLVFIFLMLVVSSIAFAQSFYKAPVETTATVTSTLILPQNNLRRYLLIQNKGAVNIIIKFGSVQSGTEGIIIPSGGNYEPSVVPMGALYMRSASSTSAVMIEEGQ